MAREEKLGDAFGALEECPTLDPNHGLACKELARLSLPATEVRAFINWLHEAQRVDERDAEPHATMAEHLVSRRRWEGADMELRIALCKGPNAELVERTAAAQAQIPEHF